VDLARESKKYTRNSIKNNVSILVLVDLAREWLTPASPICRPFVSILVLVDLARESEKKRLPMVYFQMR